MKRYIFTPDELSLVHDFCRSINVFLCLIQPNCLVADLNGANILTSNVKKFEKKNNIKVNVDLKEMLISFEK